MKIVNEFVGQPIERIEDLRLLRGRGQFVDDLNRGGLLHGAVLRSSAAHARIRSIDVSAALALAGVMAVITADTVRESFGQMPTIPLRLAPMPSLTPYEQPVIADGKVRYVGEPIVFVVAETAAVAEDGCDLILVDLEALPAVVDTATARAGHSLLFDAEGTNLAVTYKVAMGDARQAFPDAHIQRETFSTQRHTAMTMETRGLLAEWEGTAGRLSVFGAAKVPFASRRILARQMQLELSDIDMIEVDVGGSFGMRGEFFPEDFLVPFAARLLNRPVKWIEDRREHFLSSNHAREFDCELELVTRRDGVILALRGHVNANLGAYLRANVLIAPRNVGQFLSGPYRIPNIHVEVAALVTNKTPTGTYRGPGRFEADFFRERLFDMAAGELGIDRVEFRRRNLVAKEEKPFPLATISPVLKEEQLDSGDYQMTLDRCLAAIDWDAKAALQGKEIDGRFHGLGVGCFVEGGAAGPSETARAVLTEDGCVEIYVGSAIVGQGLETVLTQIAADAMQTAMERIRIFHGSTTYVRDGYGSFHSRSTVMGGTAIVMAAEKLREEMCKAAALRLNCAAVDIDLEGGMARGPGGTSVTWGELGTASVAAEATFANHTHTYAYGAHAAHVAVDVRTAQVEVLDYVAVEDVGRMVNPLALQGQVIGAVVQGLGGVFLEHLPYDAEGQLMAASLADYLVPTATDFPRIRAIVMGVHRSTISPLGAKGAGEGGVIPVAGVIANAIANALASRRVQPRNLPLSPSRLWHLIHGDDAPVS